jgi:tRNA threonylcarbamoyladenosine biosynthesis protein TsaB
VKLLAVETCLGACSAALLQDGAVLAHHYEAMERGHAEALAPMVETAMRGHDLASLDRLAVTVGPGTFTGQRVGLSFMRGLRLALNKPLVGLTSLEAIAAAAGEQKRSKKIAVIHDARRSEVYLAVVGPDGLTMPPRVLGLADALTVIQEFGPCVLAGTGAAEVSQALSSDFILSDIRQPDALFVARLAQTLSPPEEAPAPLYLRAPDAKLPGGRAPVSPVTADGDIAALATLHATAFDKPWDSTALKSLLATPGTFAFAAPSGFVLARAAAGEAEILTLAVTPSARNQGLGRTLVAVAAAWASQLGAQSMFLEVGNDNPAALALYGRLGFVRVGDRKGYYDGRDALVLKATLPLTADLAYFGTPANFRDGL